MEFSILEKVNFSENVIAYVKTMSNNINSYLPNNDQTSKFFPLKKSVSHGCPLSAYLFILTFYEIKSEMVKILKVYKLTTRTSKSVC